MLKRDWTRLVYPQIEAAGFIWSTQTVFDERVGTDELWARIQFQNEADTTRVLEMTLSKAAICNDVRGRYHDGVIGAIQDWLWTKQQRRCIHFFNI